MELKGKSLAEETANPDDAAKEMLWAAAVAAERPISFTAADFDHLMDIVFLNETATFKISEALSKLQVGDLEGSKVANSSAVDTATKALDVSKKLHAKIRERIVAHMRGEALSHEP